MPTFSIDIFIEKASSVGVLDVRRDTMKLRRVGVHGVAAVRSAHASGMAPALPLELVEEILLRVPVDEPAQLVRATLVCKAWHSILSDDTFRSRYQRFHRTPPLQGYFYKDFKESTFRFVPTISAAISTVCAPNDLHCRKPSVLDCRHGRVLVELADGSTDGLIVWDPIAGSQQRLSLPAYPQYPYRYMYCTASVLCAKNDCDHFDCHGGPFRVVFVVSTHLDENYSEEDVEIWASMYTSETGDWSGSMTPYVKTHKRVARTPSLLIGDTLYFKTGPEGYSIVKYDLCKHELSVIHLPGDFGHILIKGTDGRLGLATMTHNCICTWSSWQVDNNGDGGSVKYRAMKLDDDDIPSYARKYLICMEQGTNTVFFRVEHTGLFTVDLNSKEVNEIGETDTYSSCIFPYVSFYTPKF